MFLSPQSNTSSSSSLSFTHIISLHISWMICWRSWSCWVRPNDNFYNREGSEFKCRTNNLTQRNDDKCIQYFSFTCKLSHSCSRAWRFPLSPFLNYNEHKKLVRQILKILWVSSLTAAHADSWITFWLSNRIYVKQNSMFLWSQPTNSSLDRSNSALRWMELWNFWWLTSCCSMAAESFPQGAVSIRRCGNKQGQNVSYYSAP